MAAATLADMYSAIAAAVGTLAGPLHGGANQAVLEMLKDIGEIERVERYVDRALLEKRRIPGFGHRVYYTEGPRATHLRKMSEEVCTRTGNTKWYDLSRKIEELMRDRKGLSCNVDFYSATVSYSLGTPSDLFTPVFTVSRIAGWTTHVLEQYQNNRLIRPRAEYVGPRNRPYVPISQRDTVEAAATGTD